MPPTRAGSCPETSLPEAVPSDEDAQDRSALHVVIALAGGCRLSSRVLQAIGDDPVPVLNVARIFGKLVLVPLQELAQRRTVREIHGVVHGSNDPVFALDAHSFRGDGVRVARKVV